MQRRKTASKRAYVTEDATFVTAPIAPRGNIRGPALFDAHQAETEQAQAASNTGPTANPSSSSSTFAAIPITPLSSGPSNAYPSRPTQGYNYSSGGGAYQPSWAAPVSGGVVEGFVGIRAQAWLSWISRGGRHMLAGLKDATKLGRSIDLVQSDAELRSNVLKSSLINLISLLSVFVFDHFLLPSNHTGLSSRQAAQAERVKFWFDVLWKYPVFGFCFWMNTSWSATISKRALTLQHPTSRQAQATTASPSWSNLPLWRRIFSVAPRVFTMIDHLVVTIALSYIPLIGRPLAFSYTCLLNAYYCFDSALSSKDWSFRMIARHIGDRTAYFMGFGLIPASLCSFGPLLLGMTVFALIYPLFVIQAIQARPLPSIIDDDDAYEAVGSPKDSPMQSPGLHQVGGNAGYMSTPSTSWPSLSPVDGTMGDRLNRGGSSMSFGPHQQSQHHRAGQTHNFDGSDEGFFASVKEWFGPATGARSSGQVPVFWLALRLLDVSRWLERGVERRLKSSGMGNVAGARRLESLKGYYGGGGGGGGLSPMASGQTTPNGAGYASGYGAGQGYGATPTKAGSGGGAYGQANAGLTNRKVM